MKRTIPVRHIVMTAVTNAHSLRYLEGDGGGAEEHFGYLFWVISSSLRGKLHEVGTTKRRNRRKEIEHKKQRYTCTSVKAESTL